jgi:cold shock protein
LLSLELFLRTSWRNRRGFGNCEVVQQEKGYGFIKPDEGGSDVFVHVTAVELAGYTGLADGARISYELLPDRRGKQTAQNLRLG